MGEARRRRDSGDFTASREPSKRGADAARLCDMSHLRRDDTLWETLPVLRRKSAERPVKADGGTVERKAVLPFFGACAERFSVLNCARILDKKGVERRGRREEPERI